MEPNKIENQIKEVLRNREIQPSAQAWDRLDSMLAMSEKKPKSNYKWFAIAATLIGFSIVGIVLMNTNKLSQPKEMNNPIVKETVRPIEIQESKLLIEEEVMVTDSKPIVQSAPKIQKIIARKAEINPKKDALLEIKSKERVVLIVNEDAKIKENKYVNAQNLLAEIESKEMPVVKEIITHSKIKIDPKALLSSAEQEVKESFRDKVIQSLNKNYNTIKSTLANRNYE
jgi:hypothetical protein